MCLSLNGQRLEQQGWASDWRAISQPFLTGCVRSLTTCQLTLRHHSLLRLRNQWFPAHPSFYHWSSYFVWSQIYVTLPCLLTAVTPVTVGSAILSGSTRTFSIGQTSHHRPSLRPSRPKPLCASEAFINWHLQKQVTGAERRLQSHRSGSTTS